MSGGQKADLAISSGSCTVIWHSPGLQAAHLTSLSHDGTVNTSRWNQNNRVVVTAGASGQLALNYVTGTVMGLLPPQQDNSLPIVNSVCFSKGSKFLATGCANSEIKVWNLKRQVCQLQLLRLDPIQLLPAVLHLCCPHIEIQICSLTSEPTCCSSNWTPSWLIQPRLITLGHFLIWLAGIAASQCAVCRM